MVGDIVVVVVVEEKEKTVGAWTPQKMMTSQLYMNCIKFWELNSRMRNEKSERKKEVVVVVGEQNGG